VLILAAYSNDILKVGFKAVGLEKSSNLYVNVEKELDYSVLGICPGHMD
jgi:hypothetical protein